MSFICLFIIWMVFHLFIDYYLNGIHSIYFRAQASSSTAREQEMVDHAIKLSREEQASKTEAEQERFDQAIKASLEEPPSTADEQMT